MGVFRLLADRAFLLALLLSPILLGVLALILLRMGFRWAAALVVALLFGLVIYFDRA